MKQSLPSQFHLGERHVTVNFEFRHVVFKDVEAFSEVVYQLFM